jgi:hypothetical protein
VVAHVLVRRRARGHGNRAVQEAVQRVAVHGEVRGERRARAVHADGDERVRGHGQRAQQDEPRTHERDVVRDDARLAVRPGNLRHRREQAVAEQHDVVLRRDEGHLERRPDVARVFGVSARVFRRTRAPRSRARPSPPTPTPTRGRSKWRPCASP